MTGGAGRGALRLGIIGGAGWLGGAIARALVAGGVVTPADLVLSYRSRRPEFLPDATWTGDNAALVRSVDVVIVSVRPADWPGLALDLEGRLAISVMAGIALASLSARLGTGRVVRAMPNAAAAVGASYTPWVATTGLAGHDRAIVQAIFSACGTADEVSDEREIDYLTGLSGSGPAFPALLASAMIRDAVARGLPADIARRAATGVLIGAGRLLEQEGEAPDDTLEAFLTYDGTTAAGLTAMRAGGFDTAVAQGLAAAFQKSAGLGRAS